MTGFGYSINSDPFVTWGASHTSINTDDYRFVPGKTGPLSYTIRFKAWSDAGACAEVDRSITVSGQDTVTLSDVNSAGAYPNSPNWAPSPGTCGTEGGAEYKTWYWMWDNGTGGCTNSSDTVSYATPAGQPNIDGNSRLFYVDWQYDSSHNAFQDPGERYSIDYDNDTSAVYFVYDAYLYLEDPQNLYAVQLDTNWVNASGNVAIFGLECVHDAHTWEFTTVNANGTTTAWNNPNDHQPGWTPLPCDPQTWTTASTPDGWHHVQLVGHRFQCDASDQVGTCVSYDVITLDGTTTHLQGWYGYSTFLTAPYPWHSGDMVLNFQLDGEDCPTGPNCSAPYPEMTATTYVDGMTMIRWNQALSTTP
jgi:hypothetical protein